MKKIALVATISQLALIVGGGANAADMPVKAPRMAAPVFSWTGCYLGGHVGGLWGRTKWTSTLSNDAVFAPNQDHDFSNGTFGGQIGCNYQVNQIVFGIEGDVSRARVDKETYEDLDDVLEFIRTKSDWYGSVRGRIGIAFGQWLLYATGGVAFSNIDLSWRFFANDPPFVATARSGWTVGGGWEYALTNNWIGRLEYLYYDFGTHRVPVPIAYFNQDAHPSFHVVRLGLSYKFDWAAPIVAKY